MFQLPKGACNVQFPSKKLRWPFPSAAVPRLSLPISVPICALAACKPPPKSLGFGLPRLQVAADSPYDWGSLVGRTQPLPQRQNSGAREC